MHSNDKIRFESGFYPITEPLQPGQRRSADGKAALASSLGVDPSAVDGTELNQFMKEGAASGVGSVMEACVTAAATNAELRACKSVLHDINKSRF